MVNSLKRNQWVTLKRQFHGGGQCDFRGMLCLVKCGLRVREDRSAQGKSQVENVVVDNNEVETLHESSASLSSSPFNTSEA